MISRKFFLSFFAVLAFGLLAAVGYAQSTTLAAPNIFNITSGTNQVTLEWQRTVNDPSVTAWNIYRNGIFRTSVTAGGGSSQSWIDYLTTGDTTAYSYYIKASDGTNESPLSNIVYRTVTGGPTIVTAPYAVNIDSSSAQIMWTTDAATDGIILRSTIGDPSTDPNATTHDFRCDTSLTSTTVNHCINFLDLLPGTKYFYKVISTNSTGSITASGSLTTLSTGERVTPLTPANFTGAILESGGQWTPSVRFTWSDGKWEDQYKLYYRPQGGTWQLVSNFTQNVVTGQAPTYSGGTYEYIVKACYSVTQACSADSNIVSITMPTSSTTPPPAPSPVTLLSSSVLKSTLSAGDIQTITAGISSATSLSNLIVELRVFNSSDTLINNKQFTSVNIAAGGTATFQDNYQTPTSLLPGTYSVHIGVWDPTYATTYLYVAPRTFSVTAPTTAAPPLAPTNLRLGTAVTNGISLAWTDNSTNEDKWRIERKLSSAATYEFLAYQTASMATYTDTSATAGTAYDYRVQACLSAGCSGYATLSGVSFGTAQPAVDDIDPVAPTSMTAVALSSNRIEVSWSGATDNIGVTGYKIFINGAYVIGQTGTTYADSNVMPGTTYTYAVKAVDAAGNESLTATSRSVVTPPISITATTTSTTSSSTVDTTAPYPPYNFVTAPTATSITFTFTGSPDSAKYEVYKNDTYTRTVYEPKYIDTGLAPNTSYAYYVIALDAAGNRSAPTPRLLVRTLALTTTTTTTTTTTAATTTTTTTAAEILVEVRVTEGAKFCDADSVGKQWITFTSIPSSGAQFKIVRNNVETMDKRPGAYALPNGIYSWQAIANSGYTFDHIASDKFVIDVPCQTAAMTTATPPTPPTSPTSPTLQTSPTPATSPTQAPAATETNTTNLVVSSPAVLEPVAAVTTEEQYASYCDDPLHRTECQTYATEKIIAPSAQTTVATSPVSGGGAPIVTEDVALVLAQRLGARMFQDTDTDGITDYDEINIYFTDPKRSDTNGDGASDGDQLLSGTDPLAKGSGPVSTTMTAPAATSTRIMPASTSSNAIAYEDPRRAGEKKPFLLAVKNVEGVVKEDPETNATSTSLVLSGTALPNSFVTLYIFSDPIVVRVKADSSGAWVYTLDEELPDGTHEVVSAITDTGGRILAKSEAAPFVKTAAAVSFGASELLPTQTAPSFFSGTYFYFLVALLVALLLVAFVVVGMMVKQKNVREGGGGGGMAV